MESGVDEPEAKTGDPGQNRGKLQEFLNVTVYKKRN